jgi:hypothetical protein
LTSIKTLWQWCNKKKPETTNFDQDALTDAKERLMKEAFNSKLSNINRTKTIYDTTKNDSTVTEMNSGTISRLDKRFRLLEAKIDHLSR